MVGNGRHSLGSSLVSEPLVGSMIVTAGWAGPKENWQQSAGK